MTLLVDEVRKVMDDVLLALLSEAGACPALEAPAESRLACAVPISGGFRGVVLVHSSLGLLGLVAQCMFGAELRGIVSSQDARDALREITNIVAGNLKPLLGGHNVLGLPEDMPADTIQPNTTQSGTNALAAAMLQHASGSLEVRVFETV